MIALWWLLACTPPEEEADDRRPEVIAHLAEDVTLGHYQEFASRTATLTRASEDLCASPSPTALTAARDAWWAAREPWKQAELVQFGPVIEYPERLGPKLDDWPVNAEAVEDLVDSDTALDQASFDAMGSATRGLPVVEYLLWDEDALTALSDSRRCAVLAGAAADVEASAGRLVTAWQDDWLPQLTTPAAVEDGAYETVQEVLDEWVNRMAFTAENIRSRKLGKPNGDAAGGEPQPDVLESRPSGRSIQDARDALAGLKDVWEGVDGPGVRDLVEDADLALRIDELIDSSDARLGQIPEPLEDTIALEPELVARAQEPLQALQVAIQVDLAQALGVTITFNDNDGD